MYEIIAGSNGFIGSHLVEHLKSQDKEVVVLTREVIESPGLKDFLQLFQPFRLYYLSAYGNLHGQNDIHLMYDVMIHNLLRLLEATKDLDCQGFLTTGSTSEYGFKSIPMKEDQILEPTSFYGAIKASATHLAQAWSLQYEKPIVVFRPASVTGPREHKIHLIPTIIRSCIDQEPMQFISQPTHDYIDVRDLVKAVAILGEKAQEVKGQVFNIGTGTQWTNGAVMEKIRIITDRFPNITELKELRVFEKSEVWIADSTKMNDLGWRPVIPLDTSLRDMVEEYKLTREENH